MTLKETEAAPEAQKSPRKKTPPKGRQKTPAVDAAQTTWPDNKFHELPIGTALVDLLRCAPPSPPPLRFRNEGWCGHHSAPVPLTRPRSGWDTRGLPLENLDNPYGVAPPHQTD